MQIYYENAARHEWFFWDNDRIYTQRFGNIALTWLNLIHSCKDRETFDRDYKTLYDCGDLKIRENLSIEDTYKILARRYKDNQAMIDTLFRILPQLDDLRKHNDEADLWINCKDIVFATEIYGFSAMSDKEKEIERHKKVRCLGSQYTFDGRIKTVVPAFEAIDDKYLFSEDLRLLLCNRHIPAPSICPRCGKLHISTSGGKYCDSCRMDSGNMYYETLRQSPRFYHKKVYDFLRRRGDDTKGFTAESNYYWDRLTGEDVPENPDYTEKIQTVDDYVKWLQRTHNSLKKRKKENPPV